MLSWRWLSVLAEKPTRLSNRERRRLRRQQQHRGRAARLELLEDRLMLADWSGEIPNGTIWTSSAVQRVVGSAHVAAGATLTIEPGTIVKFNDFAGVALVVDGTLVADGTVAQPITFTSLRDDVGGDTNGDGNATSPAA